MKCLYYTIFVTKYQLGRMKGLEPSIFGTTTRRFNQLSYNRHINRADYNSIKWFGKERLKYLDVASWLASKV
jgi:hypothetical protein